MKLSIVIPVYNGASSITRLVDTLISKLAEHELEIVLVNDHSPDDSDAKIMALHETYPKVVTALSLAKNVGEHNAVMAGLNHVSGDYTVIMDDDFQNPVSEVIKLVDAAEQNNWDVVYSKYEKKRHHFLRNLGSAFNDRVANIMLKKPKHLYLSSFKALNLMVVKEIIKYPHPYPYIDGLILRCTDNIGQVVVEHKARAQGSSSYTLGKLVKLWSNMFTNFSILPLRVAMFVGTLFACFGIALAVYTAYERFKNPSLPLGWAAMMVTISLFSGIQLLALGMIGEYLGRLFISFNRSPQYTIKTAKKRH